MRQFDDTKILYGNVSKKKMFCLGTYKDGACFTDKIKNHVHTLGVIKTTFELLIIEYLAEISMAATSQC